jgi:antibiotic biosynthesis monooxygenase (ABM) superfamily enzyme
MEDGAMNLKTEYIVQVGVDVDPGKEDEWNEWYNNVHLPAIVDCPGYYSGRRYLRVAGDQGPKYATLYEVENEHVMESDLFKKRRGWAHFTNHVYHLSKVIYKLVYQKAD